jgi:DNA-binding transcriptional MocR family regulator
VAARAALAAACDATGVTLFEDDPYRDLVYDPCERRPVASLVRRASWIYQGSFSKTVAPGLRLGFLTASEDLFPHLVLAKQAADLHANRLSQWLVLRHLEDPGRAARMDRLVAAYRGKRDAFAAAMQQRLGNLAEWRTPPGGLFFWARLAPGVDTGALLERAIARNVLFAPGDHFLAAPGSDRPAMRLNFSHADPEAAERGLAVLAELIAEAQPAAPSAISRSISSVA